MKYTFLEQLIKTTPEFEGIRKELEECTETIIECYKNGGKVLVCGNGGSAADSEHIVGELLKGFMKKRPLTDKNIEELNNLAGNEFAQNLQESLPAISLVSQSGIMTAVINDLGQDVMYAQQVLGLCNENDVCIGISTSGNSVNVVNALATAKFKKAKTIALTGEKESKMSRLADVSVRVPSTSTPCIQEYHIKVYHAFCADAEEAFYKV